MEIDAVGVPSRTTIDTEYCIIGAGPAGLVVAAELCRAGHDVVLLESGSGNEDASGSDAAQELNEGAVLGAPYAGLRATRHRGVGGSTRLWNTPVTGSSGAKYVPLDACDLAGRWEQAADGWPFPMDELIPWMRRAEGAVGIATFADEARLVASEPFSIDRFCDNNVRARLYHLGTRDGFINPLRALLANASNARLYVHATVVNLVERDGVASILVATDGQPHWTVRAKRVVLAAGAVENARLLLVSASRGGWSGDRSAWLGCGFMEHPRDRSITVRPTSAAHYEALAFFDSRVVPSGNTSTTVLGRLGLTEQAVVHGHLLNASATFLPNVQPTRERVREVMVRRMGVRGLRRWLPESGHGWTRHPALARVFDGFTVLLNVEQPPRRENAITLSDQYDRYGVPLPKLRWTWHTDDHSTLRRVQALFVAALVHARVGEVTVSRPGQPDPNAHHHAGTTRMHHDARLGVVNAYGRVHGTEALFVVGASTFPTAGFANPTLTIVAMALRLADYLHRTH